MRESPQRPTFEKAGVVLPLLLAALILGAPSLEHAGLLDEPYVRGWHMFRDFKAETCKVYLYADVTTNKTNSSIFRNREMVMPSRFIVDGEPQGAWLKLSRARHYRALLEVEGEVCGRLRQLYPRAEIKAELFCMAEHGWEQEVRDLTLCPKEDQGERDVGLY